MKDLSGSRDEIELSALMRKSQAGDSTSYMELLRKISRMLKSFVENSFQRLGIRSSEGREDVIQEILLAIHSKLATYDKDEHFLPWLYAIARYKVVDHFRRNRVSLHHSVPIEDEIETLEATVAMPDAPKGNDIVKLMESLPEKQRTVLRLVKFEGLSVKEVSAKTGYSASDVKVTVHRAIKELRELAEGGRGG